MKKSLLVILFLCSFVTSVLAQLNTNNFNSFLKSGGAKNLAELAHPTNTFKEANWEYNGNYVYIYIKYQNNYYTDLRIRMSNNWFANIDVIRENDFPPAFAGLELMKVLVSELIKSSNEYENLSTFEKYLQKSFDEMSGSELSCLCMSLMWFDF